MKYYKILQFLALTSMLGSFSAFADVNYYVSPDGDDNSGDGTISNPWETIYKGKAEIRNRIENLRDNINIIMLDGTYELKNTLDFTSLDSGTSDYKISYIAQNRGGAILSGGSVISGWTDPEGDGIWEADVPPGSSSRQLYVNGEPAIRARSENGSGWSRTNSWTGTYSAPIVASSWNNKNDIELVTLYRWKMNRAPISDITGTTATVKDQHWSIARIGPFGMRDSTAGHVSWVENALELLDQEGEWYLDAAANKLYYKPKLGESLTGENSVDVVLPRLEQLIVVNSASNIEFDGLKFSHATWLKPSSDLGYVSIQSGALLTDPDYVTIEDAFDGLHETMGNVELINAKNIVIKNGVFKNLGANAVKIGEKSQNNTIFNTEFSNISASAIVVGALQKHHVDLDDAVKNNIIDNNLITHVALDYFDAVGLKVNYANQTIISNNTIHNLPSGAISTGWGWGRYDVENFAFNTDNTGKGYNSPTIAGNNVIFRNRVYDFTQKIGDTGGIYNLGASPNSRIIENLIYDANHPKEGTEFSNAVYLDNGTRGVELSGNGSFNIESHGYFCNGCEGYNTIGENTLLGQRAGSESSMPAGLLKNAGKQDFITEPRTISEILDLLPHKLPQTGQAILPTQGVLVGKTASSSVGNNASGAIDGNASTYWDMGKGNTSGWWQVNLGGVGTINKIKFALGYWDPSTRSEVYLRDDVTVQLQRSDDGVNFENLNIYTNGFESGAISTTDTLTTRQAINDVFVKDTPKARYLRLNVVNTNGQYLGLLRFKLDGSINPDVVGTNIAPQGTASQSSTILDRPADIAIDGVVDGNFGLRQVTHTDLGPQNYWELDLGAVTDTHLIRIWNRTECCASRLHDFYVFTSETPFTSSTVDGTVSQFGVKSQFISGIATRTTDVSVSGLARYIRIQLSDASIDGENVLSLAEVQVFSE